MSLIQFAKRILLIVIIAFVVNAGPETRVSAKRTLGQENDPEKRLATEYPIIIKALMPEGISPTEFPKDVKWIATVRVLPSFDNSESYVTVRHLYGGTSQASVTAPVEGSIRKQLTRALKEHPNATTEDLIKQISLSRRTVADSTCPQLKQTISQFESIKMSSDLHDRLIMDATTYEFWIQSLWGNRSYVLLSAHQSTTGRRSEPLVAWADHVAKILDRCK